MKKSISNLTLMIAFFLLQGAFFSGIAFAQSAENKQPYALGVVPKETEERLRAIYEEREFAVNSFRATWHPDGSSYMVLYLLKHLPAGPR